MKNSGKSIFMAEKTQPEKSQPAKILPEKNYPENVLTCRVLNLKKFLSNRELSHKFCITWTGVYHSNDVALKVPSLSVISGMFCLASLNILADGWCHELFFTLPLLTFSRNTQLLFISFGWNFVSLGLFCRTPFSTY